MSIDRRLAALRTYMSDAGLDACIITGSDPHNSEYPPSRWRTREWISGFTGSAGIVAVTADRAGLWTDFRYWIQADEELRGSAFELFRDGEDGVQSCEDWLASVLPRGARVGVDGRTVAARKCGEWESRLSKDGITIVVDTDPWDGIWPDRPGVPDAPVVGLDDDESGEARGARLMRLREALEKAGADTWIGIGLDSSAWLLNVRGGDVPYNPVVAGYIVVTAGRTVWFTDGDRIPEDVSVSLTEDGVEIAAYSDFEEAVAALPSGRRVLIDPETVSRSVLERLPDGVAVVNGADPVMAMKARKNPVEAANIARAMEKDGIAMVRFLMELDAMMDDGRTIGELEAAKLLEEKRNAVPGYLGGSFSTIPAVGEHGAICHYEARLDGQAMLKPGNSLFLVDSGGQWEEGTTDITRTVTLGTPTEIQREDYTLVLKGHIALARARFPRGTRGYQLDTLARAPLWAEGRNFGHGTGHGVGYRLNVHEGPQRISPNPIDVAFDAGMVVSDEPGIYREGEYGIRIENLLICRDDGEGDFGAFLAFDTLTLAPYDRRLIDVGMLTEDEISWVDGYHGEVVRRLGPMLEEDELAWLKERAAPLRRS